MFITIVWYFIWDSVLYLMLSEYFQKELANNIKSVTLLLSDSDLIKFISNYLKIRTPPIFDI